jgi:hypothetical protein
VPLRLPSLLNPERVVVWAAEVVRNLEATLSNFDRIKHSRGTILPLAVYVVADLPPAIQHPSGVLYVSDAPGGGTPAYSNGVNWLDCRTGVIIV